MTRLDDELAKAVAEAEERDKAAATDAVVASDGAASDGAASDGTAMAVPTDSPGRNGPAPQRHLGLLVGVVVVAGALVAMAMTLDPIYSRSVGKLLDDRETLQDRNVRVTGMLVKGSLTKRDDPCEYRFRIHDGERDLAVRFPQCVVPDTFRDMPGMDVEVTAEGKLAANASGQVGHFQATNIMAKCPSKYEMQERAERGEKAPHTAASPAAIPDFATVSTEPPAP